MTDDDRAVSDLVGFAAVFGIVVLSIGLVYTLGLGALTEVQQDEAVDNVERAFDIVADNLVDIHRNGAPARSTELDLEVGQLSLSGTVTMTVSNSSRNISESAVLTPITYTSESNGFYYASGAVVRTSNGAGVFVRDPPFRFSDQRTVLSFVTTVASGETTSISGSSVRLRARYVASSTTVVEDDGVTFNLSVTSPRYETWRQYFDQEVDCLQVTVDAANQTAVCRYQTDSLYVRRTLVRVTLTD